MRHKVLVETSVIVSASVHSTRQDLAQFKHPLFDRSMNIFGSLRKHCSRKIGLITQTIEKEASRVLEKAIIQELEEDVDLTMRSTLLDLCWDRMEDLLQTLVKESLDQKRVDEKFVAVVCMYKDLIDRASLATPFTIRAAVESTIEYVASRRFRRLASRIHQAQSIRDLSQLTRLRSPSQRPDITDQFILAEAAYLSEKYNTQEPTTMFLASTDKVFSPILRRDGSILSDYITSEILKRLAVYCDWPDRITRQLEEICN